MNNRAIEHDRAQNELAVREIERRVAPVHSRRIREERAKKDSGSAPVKSARIEVPRAGRFNGWTRSEESTLDLLGDIFGV